jgi:multiple sugar transport system permease protein
VTALPEQTVVTAAAPESDLSPKTQRPPSRGPQSRGFLGLDRDGWLLALPALLPVLLFSVYPLVNGMLLGFTDARAGRNATTSVTWFENYSDLLGDSYFWQSFKVGLIWAFAVTGLQFVASLGLALLLNEKLRLRWVARTLALVPWAMPPVVIGIMWRLVYHPSAGVLNASLRDIGLLDENIDWLASFSLALPAVIVVGVWAGMPQTTVVLLAGLQSVPSELHEAAAVDGAGALRRFRNVTWPHVAPVVAAMTTLDFVWNFNSFGLVYVLTQGGPGGQTRLPLLFAYEEAFRYGNYGYAAALGNVMVLVIAAFVAVWLRRRMREAT